MDNPAAASSVDSTQNATLTSAEGDEHGQQNRHTISGDRTATGSSQPSMKFSKKSLNTQSISEPYLDDDELKPLIYGYLHKLGRNGHWQRRFFETNGERLTYYKSTKRTKALATLDLVKVSNIYYVFLKKCVCLVHVICHITKTFILYLCHTGWRNYH